MPKETFKNISEEKRQRFIREATSLFAEKGYYGTDMGELARRAGVSKGSIYNYFDSKEDLFLYLSDYNLGLSRKAIYGTLDPDWDIYKQIEHIFQTGAEFILDNQDTMVVYLSMTSPGMEQFANARAVITEKFTADHLKRELAKGIEQGIVRADLDINMTAFIINGLYILFVASLSTAYFRIRLKEYLEMDEEINSDNIQQHQAKIIEHIHKMLRPPKG